MNTLNIKDIKIAVIGLGYVGLPLAVEFGKKYPVIGFDINQNRINELITNSGERCRFDHGDDGSESVRALYPP